LLKPGAQIEGRSREWCASTRKQKEKKTLWSMSETSKI